MIYARALQNSTASVPKVSMCRDGRWLVLLVVLPLLLDACQTSDENKSAHNSHEGQVQVTHIRGNESYSSRGAPWDRLAAGMFLRRGDAIRTEADAELDLRFFKTGPVARLKASSELKFVKMERWGWITRSASVTQLELIKGRVLVDDRKLPPGSRFEVRTSEGVVYSKGGEIKAGPPGMSSADK